MVAEGESMEREKDGQFTVFDKAEWGKKSWKEANEGNTKGRLELILMESTHNNWTEHFQTYSSFTLV